jgi:hypothetical protein
MTLRVDLHIHSCLSPCGDEEMTPNNLVNMAWLKGLDVIAVADHNRAANLPACARVAEARGMVLLPALEVACREEVHILCYFPTLEAAADFDAWLYPQIPPVNNRADFFGRQCVLDEEDRLVAIEPRLLVQASGASLDSVAARAAALGGVAVPAHIDRGANSLLHVLGFFPENVGFGAVEVVGDLPSGVDLRGKLVLRGSDAHRLEDIAEPGFPLEAPERSAAGVLAALGRMS